MRSAWLPSYMALSPGFQPFTLIVRVALVSDDWRTRRCDRQDRDGLAAFVVESVCGHVLRDLIPIAWLQPYRPWSVLPAKLEDGGQRPVRRTTPYGRLVSWPTGLGNDACDDLSLMESQAEVNLTN